MVDVTRRGFINLVGRAGGAAAPYNTLGAMGLLAAPGAHARRAPRHAVAIADGERLHAG